MNPIGKDIAEILTTEISELVLGTSLYINNMPTKPVISVCIYETGGAAPDNTLDKTSLFEDSVQIMVRGVNYLDVNEINQKIIKALHLFTNQLWNDTWYLFILLMNGPMKVTDPGGTEKDNKGEIIYTMNFRAKRDNAIPANPSL